MPLLTDRTALVTGASSGIGRAVAVALAHAGARLVLAGRDATRLASACEACGGPAQARAVPLDLAADDAVPRLVAAARDVAGGPIDLLVHAAGTITLGPFGEVPVAALDAQYHLNLRVPFLLTQALLPDLLARRGQVVFVNSSAGLAARAGVAQYAATKHALKALADSLREEVQRHGVRVISIYPGRTATPMQEEVCRMEGVAYDPGACLQPDDVAAMLLSAITLAEGAEVKDISIRPVVRR